MRVHQIAKRLGLTSKLVKEFATSVGVNVRSASTYIEPVCATALMVSIQTAISEGRF